MSLYVQLEIVGSLSQACSACFASAMVTLEGITEGIMEGNYGRNRVILVSITSINKCTFWMARDSWLARVYFSFRLCSCS